MKSVLENICNNKIYMVVDKNARFILAALVFLYSIVMLVRFNTVAHESLYLESPDGTLYMSIAENFLNNGHFIQNARPYEVNMIVPFGVPLFYTILLAIFHNYYPIVVIQYLLYGFAVTILTMAAKKMSGSYLAYISVPLIFIKLRNYIGEPNPSYLLTETYTIFFLCIFIYLLIGEGYTQKRIIYLYICAFAGYCFRPVVGIIILIPVFLMTRDMIMSFRNTVGGYKVKLLRYMMPVVLSAIILMLNGLVNYRETGRFVLMENYGGVPAYLANNKATKTTTYSSNLAHDFSDEYFFEVYENPDLDMNEKNELLNARTSEFIRSHLGFVLNNAVIRYKQFYHMPKQGFNLKLFLGCILFLVLVKKHNREIGILILIAFLGATIVPAFGLYIPRYGISCIPFYALAYGTSISMIVSFLIQLTWKGILSNSKY